MVGLRTWLVVVALGASVGCKRSPETVIVSRWVLNLPSELESDPSMRDLRPEVGQRINTDPSMRIGDDETHEMRIDVAPPMRPSSRGHRPDEDEDEPLESPTQRVRVELIPHGKHLAYETIGAAAVTANPGDDVANAIDDAFKVIAVMRKLDTAEERELVSALASSDERVQLFAVQRLGERKSKSAVGPLIALLNENTRTDLALRSIGALIAIGDPRAAAPMIELAHNKDPQFVLQVVFALGALGGPTAEGYLVTLASGHPVEAVRRGAEDALAEMARKEQHQARAP